VKRPLAAAVVAVAAGWAGLMAGGACVPFGMSCHCPVPEPFEPGRFRVGDASVPALPHGEVRAQGDEVVVEWLENGVVRRVQLAVVGRRP
jgi:hypothetical protein